MPLPEAPNPMVPDLRKHFTAPSKKQCRAGILSDCCRFIENVIAEMRLVDITEAYTKPNALASNISKIYEESVVSPLTGQRGTAGWKWMTRFGKSSHLNSPIEYLITPDIDRLYGEIRSYLQHFWEVQYGGDITFFLDEWYLSNGIFFKMDTITLVQQAEWYRNLVKPKGFALAVHNALCNNEPVKSEETLTQDDISSDSPLPTADEVDCF